MEGFKEADKGLFVVRLSLEQKLNQEKKKWN